MLNGSVRMRLESSAAEETLLVKGTETVVGGRPAGPDAIMSETPH